MVRRRYLEGALAGLLVADSAWTPQRLRDATALDLSAIASKAGAAAGTILSDKCTAGLQRYMRCHPLAHQIADLPCLSILSTDDDDGGAGTGSAAHLRLHLQAALAFVLQRHTPDGIHRGAVQQPSSMLLLVAPWQQLAQPLSPLRDATRRPLGMIPRHLHPLASRTACQWPTGWFYYLLQFDITSTAACSVLHARYVSLHTGQDVVVGCSPETELQSR